MLQPLEDKVVTISRAHWGVETGSHYRRDVKSKEDTTYMTIGNKAKIMACINTLVLGLLRQAHIHNAAQTRRWFSAHIPQAFALLVIPFS